MTNDAGKGTVMKLIRTYSLFPFFLAMICSVFVPSVFAQGLTHHAVQIDEPQRLQLTRGESKIIETGSPFKRASVANPEVVDQIVLSPSQIYLSGKSVGVTTLTLWDKAGKVANVFNIQVAPDIARLKEQLHVLLPEEPNLKIMSSHDHITLAGTITNAVALNKALSVAEPYAPGKGHPTEAMHIGYFQMFVHPSQSSPSFPTTLTRGK